MSDEDLGYVSHSFNQFIIIDDEKNVVGLDHGDASSTRGALLGRYAVKAGPQSFIHEYRGQTYEYVKLVEYPGESGENYTAAAIGGLTYGSSNYLTVGYHGPTDELRGDAIGNVYVSATSRSNFPKEGTVINYLSDYPQGGKITPCVPCIVKTGPDQFVVLWEERKVDFSNLTGILISERVRTEHEDLTGSIIAVKVDGNGRKTGQPVKLQGHLSDCAPICDGGKIRWFTSDSKTCDIYSLSVDSMALEKKAVAFPAGMQVADCSVQNARLVFGRLGNLTCTPYDFGENKTDAEKSLVLYHNGGALLEGRDFKFRGGTNAGDGDDGESRMVEFYGRYIEGLGDYYGEANLYAFPIRTQTVMTSGQNKKSGLEIKWERELGALGYAVERTTGDGQPAEIFDITESGDYSKKDKYSSWTDKSVKKGVSYTYRVRAYTSDGTKFVYATSKNAINITYSDDTTKVTPNSEGTSGLKKVTVSKAKNSKPKSIALKWKAVKNASGYEVQYALDKKFQKQKKSKKVSSGKNSLTLKKLKKKKTYYIRVRAYQKQGGKYSYGPWSKVKKVKVAK